jgi:hypothetical protein
MREQHLALNVGSWEGQELELEPRQVAVAELTGYVMRRYVHPETGTVLTVLLVCGHPGPIVAHGPEVCYDGAGYNQKASEVHDRQTIAGQSEAADFLRADFEKTAVAIPELLRIYWSWNATGNWSAPSGPRLAFAKYPALYKLYVVRQMHGPEQAAEKDPTVDFMREFLPRVQEQLFPDQ